jgi:hypothetical protein
MPQQLLPLLLRLGPIVDVLVLLVHLCHQLGELLLALHLLEGAGHPI